MNTANISEQQIINYLKQHPEFLVDNPQIAQLRNQSHGPITVNQLANLRQQVKQLEQQLQLKDSQIQQNKSTYLKFIQLFNAMAKVQCLSDLNQSIAQRLTTIFALEDSVLLYKKQDQKVFNAIKNAFSLGSKKHNAIYCNRVNQQQMQLLKPVLHSNAQIGSIVVSAINKDILWIIVSNSDDHFHADLDTQLIANASGFLLTIINRLSDESK